MLLLCSKMHFRNGWRLSGRSVAGWLFQDKEHISHRSNDACGIGFLSSPSVFRIVYNL